MFKLYARPSAGSAAVEALLTECGAAFEIIDILREPDGTVPRSYLQINPRGEVPTLRLPDNSIMTESAAMMVYLADLHPAAGLAPSVTSPLRGRYLRWMLFFATGVYMADLRMYFPARHSTDAGHADAIKAKAIEDMERDYDIFAEALGEGPFILGQSMSAVDIYAAMLLSWAPDVAQLFARHGKNLERHRTKTVSRACRIALARSNPGLQIRPCLCRAFVARGSFGGPRLSSF